MDHRADIYSLGVVFYQMLTGELPGKPIEPPSHRVQVDVRIDEIVLRALEQNPERRYQAAADIRTQIATVVNDVGTTRPAKHTDKSTPRLLKSGAGFVTTPEQLGTFEGQLFLWHHRSQLLLDERQLTVSRAGAFTVIPLAAIRDLSIGHYGRVMHPMGLDLISVTYDEDGQTKRLFFSPYESWFGLPSTFNRIVAEWFAAIRAAVVAATGCEPGNTPANQLGVPSGSKALYALLLLPLILGSTLVLAILRSDTGDVAISPFLGGALAIVLGVLGFGFLALVFGRLFGDGSSRGSGGSPRQASWLPPEATTGKWNILAPDASRWGSVLLAAATVAIPLGALLGKELHQRAKSTNDVALMSVAFMLYLGVGAIAVFLSWHATRLLRSLFRRGATAPSSAVSFTSPSPPRASAWPGVVFMIGMALLMTLVAITVFVGVLGWWMK